MGEVNPFFQMLPPELRPVAVVFSVAAGVIASQALITGAFTLVSEAAHLSWMPRMRIFYPSETKGQLYIPFANTILWVGTAAVILFFQTSHNMEAAYGLALTLTMLSTTILLSIYVWRVRGHFVLAVVLGTVFGLIEAMFLASSLVKFFHGGYVTVIITAALMVVMLSWDAGTRIEKLQRRRTSVSEVLPSFELLTKDSSLPITADNLVYLTADNDMKRIDRDIIYSVFANRPRRARAYWIVSIVTTNEPFTREYSVDSYGTDYFFRVRIRLGYKVNQHLRTFLSQIMQDLVGAGTLAAQPTPYPDFNHESLGDVRYVLLKKTLTAESEVPPQARAAIKIKCAIRERIGSPALWFGIEATEPIVDIAPLFVKQKPEPPLERVLLKHQVAERAAAQVEEAAGVETESAAK